MPREIIINIPDWIDESSIEEASRILLMLKLSRGKSPKGLIEELEKI